MKRLLLFRRFLGVHRAILFVLFAQLFTLTMTATEVIVDGIKYDAIKKTKQATVIANSYSGDIVIPSTFTYDNVEYSVTTIGNSAFKSCKSLTSLTIPNTVTSIENAAFYGCTSLTSVEIGNSVTSIGTSAFSNCSGLTSITIPNSVTSIGESAFRGCTGLTSVTIPNSVTSIGFSAFYNCGSLASVEIGNSVTSISGSTFYGCKSLKSITLPTGVTSIGSSAFSGCSGLTSVICLAEQVPTIGTSVFQNAPIGSATLYVPKASLDTYKSTEPWNSFGTILPIDEPTYLLGDANGNGEVEIGDVTSVLTLMATPEATGYDNKAADANGNGEIEIGDVTAILNIMANGE